MGRIYSNLKTIQRKIKETDYEPFRVILDKFVTLITYEDTYLMKRRRENKFVDLKNNGEGEELFLDCGGFGIIIDKEDNISIHT